MKKILIGIPTFNGAHRMANCLRSIEKWNDIPDGCKVEILVLDDGSTDSVKRSESLWCASHWNIPIIQHAENMGISKSWNDLCQFGNHDFFVLLNDDVLVTHNWLSSALFFIENNEDTACVGWDCYYITEDDIQWILEAESPPIIWRDSVTKELVLHEKEQNHRKMPYYIMASAGYAFMFSHHTYELANGFDEQYRSFYEEIDFGTTLASKGLRSFMLHTPMLYHLWAQTFGENADFLKPSKTMDNSRKAYFEKWGGDLEYTHKKYCQPKGFEVRWLDDNHQMQIGIIK